MILMPGMRTGMVAAGVTFFGLAFLNHGTEYRNLFSNIFASAGGAFLFALVRGLFKQLKTTSAFFTFIFKNRHIFFLFTPPFPKKQLLYFDETESGRVDLNHRPLGPEPSALSKLSYAPEAKSKVKIQKSKLWKG
jgi:hypothetical protein